MSEQRERYDAGRSELAVIDGGMSQWALMRSQAEVLVKSGFLGSVKTAEQALAIIVLGQELGFQRMQSFRLIDVIQGKPALNSHGMAALVQRYCRQHGGYLRPVETTGERAEIEIRRAEWPDAQRVTFTIDDAKRAGLLAKDTWKQYPQNMLYARCVMNACRMGWPDVVGGIYDADELGGSGATYDVAAGVSDSSMTGAAPIAANIETGEIIDEPPPDPMRRLHAIGATRGLDHDALHRIAYVLRPELDSLSRWTPTMLNDLAERIHDADQYWIDGMSRDWEAAIAACDDTDCLHTLGLEMKQWGIKSGDHRRLLGIYNQRKLKVAATKKAGAQAAMDDMPADPDRWTS